MPDRIYFIGIGGIGMSALARFCARSGCTVAGYDRTPTDLTRALEAEGIPIHFSEQPDRLEAWRPDMVVYTPAVSTEHAELARARALDLPLVKRAELLGRISQTRRTLCVAGTHGKTTTSTLVAWLLHATGAEPSAILGGISLNFGSNFLAGSASSELFVTEADEYDRSFLHLHPRSTIITYTEPDHLDIYGSAANIEQAYAEFAGRVAGEGVVLLRHGERLDTSAVKSKVCSYGLDAADCRAEGVRISEGAYSFDLRSPFGDIESLRLHLGGRHNVENAVAALALCLEQGAAPEQLRAALADFKGIRRRFEFLVRRPGFVLIDDYAHHPTELAAAIAGARELYADHKLHVIFQPHLYSRTRDFAAEFGTALNGADEAILLPIYPAREEPIAGVDSELLLRHAAGVQAAVLEPTAAGQALHQLAAGGRPVVVVCAGAGTIGDFARQWSAGLG